jgi:hypothetical protein
MSPRWARGVVLAMAWIAPAARAWAGGGEPGSAPEAAHPLPSRDVRWSLAAGGAVDVGSLPRAAPGLALGLDVRRGGLGAAVLFSGYLPQEDRASAAEVGLFDATALVCLLVPTPVRLDAGACAGGSAGLLYGAASAGEAQGRFALRPEGTAVARVDFTLVRKALVLSLDPGLVFDPLRPSLVLSPSGDAFRPASFAFRGLVTLDVRVW